MAAKIERNQWIKTELRFTHELIRELGELFEEKDLVHYKQRQERYNFADRKVEMLWRMRNLRTFQGIRSLHETHNRIKLNLYKPDGRLVHDARKD